MQDFSLPDMVHARVIRPPAIGAELIGVDEASIKDLPGAKAVRIKDFLAVTADDEWTAVRASRALRAQWSDQDKLAATLRADRDITDEVLLTRGQGAAGTPPGANPSNANPPATTTCSATYFWPMQSHASIGPSCAVARRDR
jgi:nicotinate dehydrogenase subunit B